MGVGVEPSVLDSLMEINQEWKDEPGSDGDPRLEIWVDLLKGPKSGKVGQSKERRTEGWSEATAAYRPPL